MMNPNHHPMETVHVESDEGQWTLVFVRELRNPPDRVWTALTDPAELARWAPYTSDRDLGATGDATLIMIEGETRVDIPVKVSRAEPPALLEYTWGTDALRWELASAGAGTRLTLRHTVAGPDWLPKVAAGWHLCFIVAERLLDGDPIPPIRGAQALEHGWQELNDAYARKFGLPTDPT
jgi:uncharacterized protein YndB with AHSA1/START domain